MGTVGMTLILLSLSLLFVSPISELASAAGSVSSSIFSQGTIAYVPTPTSTPTPTPTPTPPPSGDGLVYSTDFEDVTVTGSNYLSLTCSHYMEMRNGGIFWIENSNNPSGSDAPTPRSGTRCLGMQTPNNFGSAIRAEFNLMSLHTWQLPPNEIFVSVWLYFPSDWALSRTDYNWFELMDALVDPNGPGYYPKLPLHITKNPSTGAYALTLRYYPSLGNGYDLGSIQNFVVPRGEWFNIKFYVKRATSDAIVKMWISTSYYGNDYVLADVSGYSMDLYGDDWYVTVAKSYMDGDGNYHRVWCDDLEIWSRIPS